MRPSPYRQAVSPPGPELEVKEPASGDFELVPVFGVLWAVSVAQVTTSMTCRRELGTSDALAGALIVLLPFLVREPLRILVARFGLPRPPKE